MKHPIESIQAVFEHRVYGPRGEHEGVLLKGEDGPLQLVFERHDSESASAFDGVRAGQTVSVEAVRAGPSPKGDGVHPVYEFGRLLAVDGQPPRKPESGPGGPAYRGRVVRLNHARHGAPNGVVLDTGDFIHTRPEGMVRLGLKVGDTVHADGDAQRLVDDTGWAVEATDVRKA